MNELALAGAHSPGVEWTGHTPPGRVFVYDPAKSAVMGDEHTKGVFMGNASKGALMGDKNAKGALMADVNAHPGLHVREIVFLQDGKRLGSCADGDVTVCISDVKTSAVVFRLTGHTGPVLSVAAPPAEW
jgi:WD40 repeat protein